MSELQNIHSTDKIGLTARKKLFCLRKISVKTAPRSLERVAGPGLGLKLKWVSSERASVQSPDPVLPRDPSSGGEEKQVPNIEDTCINIKQLLILILSKAQCVTKCPCFISDEHYNWQWSPRRPWLRVHLCLVWPNSHQAGPGTCCQLSQCPTLAELWQPASAWPSMVPLTASLGSVLWRWDYISLILKFTTTAQDSK